MQLFLQTQKLGNVGVIRCRGRLVMGDEVSGFQLEVEKLTQTTPQIVLQLAELDFIDSCGLGALIRLLGILRKSGGDLRVCEASPFVLEVLQLTNLDRVFPLYHSERDAIGTSFLRPPHPQEASRAHRARVVCIDTSRDLLAYFKVLLQSAGYLVFVTRPSADAATFIKLIRPGLVILGPGMQSNLTDIEDFRKNFTEIPILTLPADFAATEASQARADLINRMQSVLSPGG